MEKGRISQVLEKMAGEYGFRLFMISGDKETTYGDFFESVQRLAKSLLATGIQKGDRVGIWLSNRLEFTLIEMAANLIGAVGVPISTRHSSSPIEDPASQRGRVGYSGGHS